MTHPQQVSCAVFSPDGKVIATGGYDNMVRLWDAATGKPLGPTLAHMGRVRRIAFSPDGRLLLTGSFDQAARLWDTATWKPVGQPLRHQGAVGLVDFSPDGTTLLTAGDKTVRLWDTASLKPVGRPLQHLDALEAAAFSPDGRTVLTGSADRTARLWDVRTGLPLGPPLDHQGTVWAVAFSPDGKLLVTAGDDQAARLWRVPAPVEGDAARLVRWVEVSSGHEVQNDGTVRLLDAPTWQERRRGLDGQGGPPAPPQTNEFGWHQRLAAENEESGHWFAARWHLDRLIAARPDDWFAHALRSRAEVALLRPDEAAADCARPVELGPADTVRDWLTRQSPDYDAAASWETALWYLDHLIAARPRDGVAHALRAKARVELGRLDEAAADFARAVELGPRDDVLARCRAYWEECETKERWQPGTWYLERLADAQPLDWFAPAQLGKVHGRLGRYEESLRWYDRAAPLRPADLDLWHNVAILRLHLGDLAGYRRACAHVAGLGLPEDAGAEYTAAWTWVLAPAAVPNRARPVQTAERAVTKKPRDPAYLTALGAALYRAGRYEEAVRRLDEATQEHALGGSVPCWLFLAMTHQRLGHVAEAGRWLDRAAEWLDQSTPERPRDTRMGTPVLWPALLEARLLRYEAQALVRGTPDTKDAALLVAYGRAHVRLGQWVKAAADFGRATELGPADAAPWGERGRCYAQLRQWNRAVADYSRAVEARPEDAELRVERCRCYRELNQPARADADADKVVELATKVLQGRRAALDKDPTVLAYRVALGEAYLDLAGKQRRVGRFAEAAAVLEQFMRLWPGHAPRLHEAARRLALCIPPATETGAAADALRRQVADQAMEALGRAVLAGFTNVTAVEQETNLDPLRSRDDFKALLRRLELTGELSAPTAELRRLTGRVGDGEAVAFSPDGRRALSGGRDGTLRLVDVGTGHEVRRFGGHKGAVSAVAFFADGRRALSAGADRAVRLWDVESGEPLHCFEGCGAGVLALAVAPDGRRALSGGEDKTVRLWDLETGRELRHFDGHQDAVSSVAFAPDGRRALSGGRDGFVVLWDIDGGLPVRHLLGHWNGVRCVSFSPDGRRTLSGSQDGRLILWDADAGRELHRFTLSPATAQTAVSFSPDGLRALSAGGDGAVRLWALSEEAARARDEAALGRLDAADAGYARAIAGQPAETHLRVERARVSAWQGRWDAAVADLSAALAAEPGAADLWADRARCHAAAGRPDAAATDFARALALSPTSSAAWWSGRSEVADDLARRDEVCARVAELRPSDRDLWAARARYHAWHGQWDRARAASARLLELEPNPRGRSAEQNDYQHLAHACLQLLAGDQAGYRQLCRAEAERLGPTNQYFALHLVDRVCALGPGALADPEEAVRMGERAVAGRPVNDHVMSAITLYGLGAAHYRAGHFEEAIRYCRESTEKYSGWNSTCLNWPLLALACHHRGQPEEARRCLDRTTAFVRDRTRNQPGNDLRPPPGLHAVNWLELQVLLREAEAVLDAPHRREAEEAVRRRQWSAAIEHLDRLIEADPGFWPDRKARADCFASLGQWDRAVAEFARVHAKTPGDPLNWYYLAAARLGAGDLAPYRQTCADMLKAFEGTRDRTAASRTLYASVPLPVAGRDAVRLAETAAPEWQGNVRVLGAALYRAGRHDAAVQRFDEASRVSALRAWDWLFLAMAHHRLGRAGQARHYLTEAARWIDAADRPDAVPEDGPRPAWVGWYEQVEVGHLRREAEALLREAGEDGKD